MHTSILFLFNAKDEDSSILKNDYEEISVCKDKAHSDENNAIACLFVLCFILLKYDACMLVLN